MPPSNDPSGRRSTALHDPAMAAVVISASANLTVATLCGIVTNAPRTFRILNTAGSTVAKSAASTAIGTTTASMPWAANQGL